MTKLFKNDLFLLHDSVVKAGSGAQFCGDIHYMPLHLGGGPSYFNDIKLYILHVILFVHVPLSKKKLLGNQGPTLHPFGSFAVYWVGTIQKENSCWILYKK